MLSGRIINDATGTFAGKRTLRMPMAYKRIALYAGTKYNLHVKFLYLMQKLF